jgi:hypothetical protein
MSKGEASDTSFSSTDDVIEVASVTEVTSVDKKKTTVKYTSDTAPISYSDVDTSTTEVDSKLNSAVSADTVSTEVVSDKTYKSYPESIFTNLIRAKILKGTSSLKTGYVMTNLRDLVQLVLKNVAGAYIVLTTSQNIKLAIDVINNASDDVIGMSVDSGTKEVCIKRFMLDNTKYKM